MHSDRLCTHWDTKSTLNPCKGTRQKARDENKIGKVGMCLRQIPSAWLVYFLASTLLFGAQQRDDLSLDWALASILTEPIQSFRRTVCLRVCCGVMENVKPGVSAIPLATAVSRSVTE